MDFSFQGRNLTAAEGCDGSFGPSAYDCGAGRFDFTLLFEQSILAIGPSAVLLLAVPLRLFQLLGKGRKVYPSPLALVKLAACVIYGALQLALLVLWARASGGLPARGVSIAASSLGMVDALALTTLSCIEHSRSVRPSTIISLYLLSSTLFDAVQCRTLWLIGGASPLAAVFTAMVVSKFVLFVFEIQGKRRILLQRWASLGREATSGIVSRGLFWWLNDLMMRGFRASLSAETLYDTDRDLRSEPLLRHMQENWRRCRGSGRHALLLTLLRSTKGAMLLGAFPRLCLTGFKIAQPFLITRVIDYVQKQGGVEAYPKSAGYALIAASALVYAGMALATGFYQHKVYRLLTIIRGSLVSLVLFRTTELDPASTAGSGALTLITADVNQISGAFEGIHEIWANVIEVSLAIWLLQRQIGVGCVGPAIIVILCTIAMVRLSKFMGPASKVWNAAIQKRVTDTSGVISSMKETKMLGLVDSWTEAIQALRVRELQLSKKFRILIMWLNVISNAPFKLAPVLTFGIAILASGTGSSQGLTIATTFTSMTIIGLITEPLAHLLSAVPSFFSSLGCFERLQAYLDDAENDDASASDSESSVDLSGSTTKECRELDSLPSKATDQAVVVAKDASFRPKRGDRPILREIDLAIPPRSLTVVTGKVGSGKTVLLRGLLGQLHSTGHLKTVGAGAAYCAQTTWLVNSTVRLNILGQSPMDDGWYATVVSACALDKDFAQLPSGDDTMIGSKGLSLSGGQKQRIALARAVYSRKPVMFIDDVLSGLDWATQRHVWTRVFGPSGLLRKNNATVILATHTLNLLGDDDRIVLLGDDGRIADQGSFGSLKDKPQLKRFMLTSQDRPAPGDESADDVTDAAQQQASPAKANSDDGQKLDLLRQSGDTSLYWYYLKSIGWVYGLTGLAIGVAFMGMNLFPELWLKTWSEANERGHVNTGMYFGIFTMASVVGLLIIGVDVWFYFVKILPKSAGNLHLTLLRTVMRAPLSFFVAMDSGDLVNRFSKDMSLIDRELPTALYTTCSGVLGFIGQTILVMQGAQYLGATVPVILVFLYGLQKFYLRTSRQLRYLDLQATAPLYTHLLETIDGLATIQAFGWESAFRETSLRLLDDSQKPHYLLFCVQRWLTLVLDLFVAASAVLLVTFGVVTPSATSAGAMALALTNILGLSSSLANLIQSWTSLETSLGAIARLRAFEADTPAEIPPAQPEMPPAHWPSQGGLDIRGITASYATETRPALNNMSLTIKPGQKVAICGRTGSGKSSLLLTLFRLLDLDSGAIVLDDMDISHIPQNVLRPRLIAVPQEPMLFPGSLRSNLSPGRSSSSSSSSSSSHTLPGRSDEYLVSCLEKVELWDAISLHGGLDTDVADLALSHGQRQLLCLARALARREASAVVVLDEAMSAVDQHTEDLMVRVLEEEFAGHTVVSVVHRLNTVRGFDAVVMLEGGEIVEMGAPGALLEREGGRFRALWNGQG